MKKNTSPSRRAAAANGSRSGIHDCDNGQLLRALMAFKRGDFSVRLPDDWTGVAGKIADTFNEVIARNQRLTMELDRIGRAVGKKRRITQRASLGDVSNSWAIWFIRRAKWRELSAPLPKVISPKRWQRT